MRKSRLFFGLGFVACAASLTTAIWYFENTLGLSPCPLCMVQRLVFVVLGAVFLIAFLHNPQQLMRLIYGFLLTLIPLIGASISAWHVHIQNLPDDKVPECGPGLEYMLEVLPLNDVITKVFMGSGECHDVLWSFLGLSIPAWTLVGFVAFAVYGVSLLIFRR